jgi:uncharacterized protein (TIGR02646 family)
MKPVRRLAAEPQALAAYREANPADDAAPAGESAEVWERFRSGPAYQVVLNSLREAQQGLCIYCEQRVVDGAGVPVALDHQIEHVQPKSGAARTVLDWRNLALACCGGTFHQFKDNSRGLPGKGNESCGQHKGRDELRPNCDPRDFPKGAAPVEVSSLDGRLIPNVAVCNHHGLPQANLDVTINDILNLNCERLRFARQKVYDNIRTWLVPLVSELLNGAHLSAAQQEQLYALLVADRLQPDAGGHLRAFWTTERCALGDRAGTWVQANLALFT